MRCASETAGKEKWTLYTKDRALERIYWTCDNPHDSHCVQKNRSVESSEALYWLDIGTEVWMSKDADDDEFERAVRKQIAEFRRKHDPSYYCGDSGDEQEETDPSGHWIDWRDRYVPEEDKPSPPKITCTCDIKVLMDQGCVCGGFQAEQEAKDEN